jgi:dienelactone hydrolase
MFPGRTYRPSIAVSINCALAAASFFVSASRAADDLAFRRHVINADSEFMSAAVFDVNKDGKLDIVCGGFWYEGPDFTKKHFLRNVEVRGGRPDGYAHQVLDVNGDGWPDLVTVNWRTSSLKWIEHPGLALPRGEEWKAHTIAVPGPSETGRLVDLLGDGTPVLLPCGSNFAAWWELKRPAGSAAGLPEWIRHDLPRELAGHGLGWGDINGDGRMDLVGHSGWAEAPVDRRKGRWIWHADFELDQACIPVLVVDVDGDGLNDIVYTRGHDFGIYWLQQERTADGKISWTKHAIDTTVPGAHAPLWEDLDGDGIPELIVGRRYLAHEGRDPAEYDPLSAYRYQFDRKTRTWKRWLISYDDGVCFGLDPKAVDLTGSGRKDLIQAGRHGLYRLENLGKGNSVAMKLTKDPRWHPAYADHQNLLVVKDESGKEKPVANQFDWGRRRAHILAAMQDVFGVLPDSSHRPPLGAITKEYVPQGESIYQVGIASDGQSRAKATVFVPAGLKRNAGAVICLEDGANDSATKCAIDLVKRGYVCLIPASPSDEQFANANEEYTSGCMKRIWNNIRWIDFLETIPEISYRKIAILGRGPAGLDALLTAAFDSRVAAVVSIDGFTNFADCRPDDLATWSKPSMAPRIHTQFADDPKKIPFDFAEVLATLAPRAALVIASEKHRGIEGIRKSCASAEAVYHLKKAPTALKAIYPQADGLSESTRNEIYTWLDQKVKRP